VEGGPDGPVRPLSKLHFESFIDATDFGTVAAYLRNPRSPIHTVLHVRDRRMLATLAEELTVAAETPSGAGAHGPLLVRRLLAEDAMRVSSRDRLGWCPQTSLVDVSTIPSAARCDVIYLPPFYLVHTPGLFEGTLVRPTSAEPSCRLPKPAARIRIKL
jgi:hypothetical protein